MEKDIEHPMEPILDASVSEPFAKMVPQFERCWIAK
jgi:hypothetical protein